MVNKKVFVLDTSVLVYDPQSIYSFDNEEIVLPITILEELDKLKKFPDQVGRNARKSIKMLDEISNAGDIIQGIILDNGSCIKIDNTDYSGSNDSKILMCAKNIQLADKDKTIYLISKDINLRVRAKAAQLIANDYDDKKVLTDELYSGYKEVVQKSLGSKLQTNGWLNKADVDAKIEESIGQNEFILFLDSKGDGVAAGRAVGDKINLVSDKSPWGLKLRGKEQLFAADLLLDNRVPLVSIIGTAGCGKTLCAVAAGLELVLNQRKYDNLIIYRPIQTVGAEIGFLPGSVEEKIAPFYGPIHDAFSLLLADKSKKKDGWKTHLYQYIDSGIIQQEAIAFVRGRSIHNAFVIVDEAQNLSKEDTKTILTRIGENSKIIFCGDIEQIDVPNLDVVNNGLTHLINVFKGNDIAGHITLRNGERSKLSALAAKLM